MGLYNGYILLMVKDIPLTYESITNYLKDNNKPFYEHIQNVIRKIIVDLPSDPVKIFEDISQ